MSDVTDGIKLAKDLDAALAAYQRQFGRERTIEKLAHMLAARQAAQRLSDEAKDRIGFSKRAAE